MSKNSGGVQADMTTVRSTYPFSKSTMLKWAIKAA
jgi:hypothetical protein